MFSKILEWLWDVSMFYTLILLGFFLNWFLIFYYLLFDYLALSFIVFSLFFSIKSSCFYITNVELVDLTWIGSGFFIFFSLFFFHFYLSLFSLLDNWPPMFYLIFLYRVISVSQLVGEYDMLRQVMFFFSF